MAVKKRLKARQEKTPRQARKDSKVGKKRLKGRPKRLNARQEKTPRQARKDSKAGRKD